VTPSEWSRVNDLFHRALAEPADRRAAFIAGACLGAPQIEAEVRSLLAAHDRADTFIEGPAPGVPSADPHESTGRSEAAVQADLAGQQIGPYRIERLLGRGGMGVVYLAEDTRLGRTVALKAVAPRYTDDDGRRERLRREARAAASLSHPGIATVYALEEFGAQLYLACEYVPGETLRAEIGRGPLSVGRSLQTALSLARALASAHDRGVVHRDLKPENVIRSPQGDIKILDFGLAQLRDTPQLIESLTEDGMVLGTPAYMSPEQARGRPVDFRSDLFSLGIILYELVSGIHPFSGTSTAPTIVNILENEPPRMAERRPDQTALQGLEWIEPIARTCLKKDPNDRYRSTHALVKALEEAEAGLSTRVRARPLDQPTKPAPDQALDPRWWWQFHQAAVAIIYCALLAPVWYARKWTGGVAGPLLFLAALVTVIVACTLRLHLWFTLRSYPALWRTQRDGSARWIWWADVSFVAVLAASAGFLLSSHGDFAILLVGIAVAVLLSATVVEPATTRAAFGAATGTES
jgi:eukaryotic-like serine/threonine-protein kinase